MFGMHDAIHPHRNESCPAPTETAPRAGVSGPMDMGLEVRSCSASCA